MTETLDFIIFYADEQEKKNLFLVRLLFMEYFSSEGVGLVGSDPRCHHASPAAAMVTKPLRGFAGRFLDGVFSLNICILILCLGALRTREHGTNTIYIKTRLDI